MLLVLCIYASGDPCRNLNLSLYLTKFRAPVTCRPGKDPSNHMIGGWLDGEEGYFTLFGNSRLIVWPSEHTGLHIFCMCMLMCGQ
jgi:hypothetical protein